MVDFKNTDLTTEIILNFFMNNFDEKNYFNSLTQTNYLLNKITGRKF